MQTDDQLFELLDTMTRRIEMELGIDNTPRPLVERAALLRTATRRLERWTRYVNRQLRRRMGDKPPPLPLPALADILRQAAEGLGPVEEGAVSADAFRAWASAHRQWWRAVGRAARAVGCFLSRWVAWTGDEDAPTPVCGRRF